MEGKRDAVRTEGSRAANENENAKEEKKKKN